MELSHLNLPKTKENQLRNKGLNTIEDVLEFLPKSYYDFTTPLSIRDSINVGFDKEVAIIVTVTDVKETPKTITAIAEDDSGQIEIVFFNQKFRLQQIVKHLKYIICGKFQLNKYTGQLQMVNPVFLSNDITKYAKILPKYGKIKGMSNDYLLDVINKCLDFAPLLKDYDNTLLEDFRIMDKNTCLNTIHRPPSFKMLSYAHIRLIFDLLFKFLWLAKEKEDDNVIKTNVGIANTNISDKLSSLPFPLTKDQENVLNRVLDKISKGQKINGLIQGDVGCGKTIVAFLLMFVLADNGYQSILAAPTQTLANQHFIDIQEYADKFGYKVEFLSGSTKKRDRKKVLKGLADGSIDILISTHAGFSPDVEFNNLGLKIIDEEHRFGVNQREALSKRYKHVHNISMSATPIPRSLALISYGNNVDIYNILELPKGRQKIDTEITDTNSIAYAYIKDQVQKGHQAYIICPLIDEGKIDAENIKNTSKNFSQYLKLNNLDIKFASISGDMKQKEIDQVIESFNNHDIDVLISTTIVEVGVNVPNATVMVILSAERFGLSQLHQLRGRVGRGQDKSYCILVSSKEDIKRLDIMKNSTSGFEISKEDLKLRGPGDILGVKQSGESKELMTLISYPQLADAIRQYIIKIYNNTYRLEYYKKLLTGE